MIKNYAKDKSCLKPKKSTIDFILNYSKNLQISRVKNMSFEVFQS